MKVSIIGSGMVGATTAYALVMRGIAGEILLVDTNTQRAQAEADDVQHAVPFAFPASVRAGDYAETAGSNVVIVTAGVSQKPGETRLQLLEKNAKIMQQIVPNVLQFAPESILLVASNPVDVMTHLAAEMAAQHGISSGRVVGSGTTLDTARFRALLGRYFGIDSQHVHAYVIGEHGDSEVLPWSLVTIGGMPLEEFCSLRGSAVCEEDRLQIESQVRQAAYQIIAGKGATYYGIGSAVARIVEVILKDQRSILTVCSPVPEAAGVAGITISLPHLVGGAGILDTYHPKLNEQEGEALHASAALVKQAIDAIIGK